MQDLHSGTITRAYCRAIYEESVSRCFILPPEQGEVRRSPDRGVASAASQSPECQSSPMTQKSKFRNADFISIAAERQSATLGAKGPSNLRTLRPIGPVHLKNPPS